ncbi:hypothetical protein T439DRAFT_358274 [Meredithblackwellia eburnea MCA 4105]
MPLPSTPLEGPPRYSLLSPTFSPPPVILENPNHPIKSPHHRTTPAQALTSCLRGASNANRQRPEHQQSPLLSPRHHIISINSPSSENDAPFINDGSLSTSFSKQSYFPLSYTCHSESVNVKGTTKFPRTPLCSPVDENGPVGVNKSDGGLLTHFGLGMASFGLAVGVGLGITKGAQGDDGKVELRHQDHDSDREEDYGEEKKLFLKGLNLNLNGQGHESEKDQGEDRKGGTKRRPSLRISDMPPAIMIAPPTATGHEFPKGNLSDVENRGVLVVERSVSASSARSDETVTSFLVRTRDAGMTPGRAGRKNERGWLDDESERRFGFYEDEEDEEDELAELVKERVSTPFPITDSERDGWLVDSTRS